MTANYLIFGKWESKAVVNDPGLGKYINLEARVTLNERGRYVKKRFGKTRLHIVERLINSLMRGGTGKKIGGKVIRDRGGCGKKSKMTVVARKAFDLVEKKTKKNPVQVFITAIENAAPREEVTRIRYGGMICPIAVDVSPQRRIDFALRNIGRAVAIRSFDNKKSAEFALAEELVMASSGDPQSHAVARKIEVERVARGSR
ncbi:MAG: 30S ribosomal protein S7 [Candidatus Micrarchaeota archaeon]